MEPAPTAGRLPRGALAGPTVYEVPLFGGESPGCGAAAGGAPPIARPAADFAGAPPLLSACLVGHHVAAVTPLGEVLCSVHPGEALVPVPLPWPAAAVSCGTEGIFPIEVENCYAVALQRGGGAVCKWRLDQHRHGSGVAPAPEIVQGLPSGDPVVTIEAGYGIAVALTASGAACGWGHDMLFRHFGAGDGAVARIPQLSGRRIRRLACGRLAAYAETEAGELLSLGLDQLSASGPPVLAQLPADAAVAFPLRDLVAVEINCVQLVDAVGRIWAGNMVGLLWELTGSLPAAQRQRSVQIRRNADRRGEEWHDRIVTMTDGGELWTVSINPSSVQRIRAVRRELPRGLLSHGGGLATRVVLLPDLSCGPIRVRTFARIAVRLRLPSDPVRVQLLRYAVQSCHIVGPEEHPLGWPRPAAPAAAAAGR